MFITVRRFTLLALATIAVLASLVVLDAQKPTAKTPAKTPAKAPAGQKPAAKKPAAAPARKPAAPRVEAAVPFAVGETLTYDVSWSNTLSAGTATLRVAEKKPSYNSVAYYIVAEAQPGSVLSRLYTLYYKADTLLDVYTLLPQRGSLFSKEGKRQRMKITEFNQNARTAKFQMQTASLMVKDLAVPADAQDILSAIYSLRASPATTGDRLSLAVADSGRLYNVEFVVGARENVKGPGGANIAALRVTPNITDDRRQAVGRGTVMWLSDDARRVPLRLEAQLTVGRFVLSLR